MFYLISVVVLLEIAHRMGCVSRWFYHGFMIVLLCLRDCFIMALRLFYHGFKVVENKKRACLLYDTPSLKRYFMIFIFAISISS